MKEKHREPEVPEERVPAWKSGTLQNACSTRPRVVANLVKCACSHAHRQVDEQPCKKSKKNDDKSAVAMLKKHDLHDRTGQPVVNRDKSHDRTGQPVVNRDTRHESNHGPVGCRSLNTRQMGCVFQDMEPPKLSSILQKSSDMQKPIQRVKFTKAIARHTKIRDQNPSLGLISQVNLISVAATLQNLRIGLRRRQSGKSKVPAKQRGRWPKVC